MNYTLLSSLLILVVMGIADSSSDLYCDCQCSGYAVLDSAGQIHGNCQSTIRGRQWCWVDPSNQNCVDLLWDRIVSRLWSFQACYTPTADSPECTSTSSTPAMSVGF